MVITVINQKGGVGKTPIAFSLAKDLDLALISNDDSIIERIYSKAVVTDKPRYQDDTVYDFGGFTSAGILDIVKSSDAVLIPCNDEYNAIIKTARTASELYEYNKNIIILVTRITNGLKQFVSVKNSLNELIDFKVKYYPLRNSKI